MNADEQLSAQCRDLRRAIGDGIAWLADHGSVPDVGAAAKELKRTAVAAAKLERAARRRMCVGVFGPSQAGKSYLISALARRGQERLIARLGGREIDFIADINPEGGKESTGVVTRFSISDAGAPPEGHPVELRLLSDIDLLKILVNSYVHDLRHDREDEEQHDAARILEQVERIGARAGGTPDPALAGDQLIDLEEYCSERLIGNPRMKVLRRIGFWNRLAELAPRLAAEDRTQLFALLWDGLEVYTAIYRRLHRALAALGFPATAFCALDGLLRPLEGGWARREDSIVNVDTLAGLSQAATAGDTVSTTAGGRTAMLGRPELTAVTAELCIRMRDKAYDFFDHTDLLDFPGARSRKAHEVEHVTEPGVAEELFLRGKVAYLFERYCAEQELTAMLLCMGPENMEVVSLPGLVFEWIRTAQGERPADRGEQPTALFLVMTKFDTAFAQAAGKGAGSSRWASRLQTSLLKPFGAHPAWPLEWSPGRPFRNSFWVRNPNFRQDALFDYADGESLDETGLRADKLDFVHELRDGYLACEEVQQHFADPAEAWEGALALNDGGISLIVRKLEPLCNPALKRNQVSARMRRLRELVLQRLQPFFFGGDLNAEQAKQEAMVQGVAERLSLTIAQRRFGEFLASLHVTETAAYDVYVSCERRAARSGGMADRAAILGSVFRRAGTPAPATPDRADGFPHELQSFWVERMQSYGQDPNWLAYFELSAADIVNVAQELATGLRRTGAASRIAAAVRRGQQFKNIDRDALIWKQVLPASLEINQFVDWLDCGGPAHPAGTVVDVDGESRTLFAPPPPVGRYPALADEPLPFEMDYAVDWLIAFRTLVRDNVAYRAGAEIDLASNARLGAVLGQLGGGAPALAVGGVECLPSA